MPLTPTDGSGTYWVDGLPILVVRRATEGSSLVGTWLDGLPFVTNDDVPSSTGTVAFGAPAFASNGTVVAPAITGSGAVSIPALAVAVNGAAWNAIGPATVAIPAHTSSGLGSTLPISAFKAPAPAFAASGEVGAPANVTFGVPAIEGSVGVIGPSTIVINPPLVEGVALTFDPPGVEFGAPSIDAVGDIGSSHGVLTSVSSMTAYGQEGHWPESTTLRATVEDDSWGGALTYEWTQISGPAIATIVSPTSQNSQVIFEEIAGVYVFQLEVSREDGLVGTSLVRVRIITAAVPALAGIPEDPGIVTLEVNGVLRAATIDTTRIADGVDQVSNCLCTLFDGVADVSLVQIGDEVVLSRYGERLFGGLCRAFTVIEREGYPVYSVSLIGYAWHLGRTQVTKTYVNWPIMAIVADLLSMSVGGITFTPNISISTPQVPAPAAIPPKTLAEVVAMLQASHDANTLYTAFGSRIGYADAVTLQGMASVPTTKSALEAVIGVGDLRNLMGNPVVGGPVAVTGISIKFVDKPIDECLTELTNYGRGLHWRVDPYKKLHFAALETDEDPEPITIYHPKVKDLSVTHSMGKSANRVKIYYTEPSVTAADEAVSQGTVMGPIEIGATNIQVSSLDGWSQIGGTFVLNGMQVSYGGTWVRRSDSVFDRVSFGRVKTEQKEGGSLGNALAEKPATEGGGGYAPIPDDEIRSFSPAGFYNPRGYWLSLSTPDGETPLMQYFSNGGTLRTGQQYPVTRGVAGPTGYGHVSYGISGSTQFMPINEGSIEITLGAIKYQNLPPQTDDEPVPRKDRCSPPEETTVEDRQATTWARITAVNIYRDSRQERSRPADVGKYVFLVGSLSPRGGKFVDGTPKWDMSPVVEPPYDRFGPASTSHTAKPCSDGSYPWDPPSTFWLVGVIGVTSKVAQPQPEISKTFVIINDVAAQYALAARLGVGDTGVIEATFDVGTKSRADATALGQEYLLNARAIDTQVSCTVQDNKAKPGSVLDMLMPAPYGAASLKIRSTDIQGFELGVRHDQQITAATDLVTMNDLLKGIGGGK